LWVRQEGGYKDEEGGGLDGGAVVRVQQVEEEVHVDFAAEDGARWRVQEKEALEVGEGGEDEEVVLAVCAISLATYMLRCD
jgi:hypothetical protein